MSRLFIVAIGGLQFGACVSKLCARDWAMATVWAGYFIANMGLLLAQCQSGVSGARSSGAVR